MSEEATAQPTAPPRRLSAIVRMTLFVLAGAIAGLAYQRLVGCSTGTCLITSSPWTATAYGAVVGYLASGGRSKLKA